MAPDDAGAEVCGAGACTPAAADTPAETAGAAAGEAVGAGADEAPGAEVWLGAGADAGGEADVGTDAEAPALADATGELTVALAPADTPEGETPTFDWTPIPLGLDVEDEAGADVAAGAGAVDAGWPAG